MLLLPLWVPSLPPLNIHYIKLSLLKTCHIFSDILLIFIPKVLSLTEGSFFNRHMKRYSITLIIRKKTHQNHSETIPHTCYYGFYQKQEIARFCEDVEKIEHLCTVGGYVQLV